MRPILLIYERVKNNESSVENAENKYLGITQKEREESALAYLQNEKNQLLIFNPIKKAFMLQIAKGFF